jgi:hypothetical protein
LRLKGTRLLVSIPTYSAEAAVTIRFFLDSSRKRKPIKEKTRHKGKRIYHRFAEGTEGALQPNRPTYALYLSWP